jgi:phosphatidate cytidylyltransferase
MSQFARKLLLACVLAPPFIAVWWLGAPYFNALMTVFSAVAAYEVVGMATTQGRTQAGVIASVGAVAILLPVSFTAPWAMETAIFCTLIAALVAHLFRPGDMSSAASRVSITVFAALYGALPISYLLLLRMDPEFGRGLAFTALACAWFCDTFAYFGGRLFGKHKLYPRMSPNKTVEGLFSGMLAAAATATICTVAFHLPLTVPMAFGLGLLAGAVGQTGDLCESLLKRSWGVKDAGTLLGSHGGVLDRFDAVLFVAPLFYFAWRLLSHSA